jgi:hypothetical protein
MEKSTFATASLTAEEMELSAWLKAAEFALDTDWTAPVVSAIALSSV